MNYIPHGPSVVKIVPTNNFSDWLSNVLVVKCTLMGGFSMVQSNVFHVLAIFGPNFDPFSKFLMSVESIRTYFSSK